MTSKLSVFAKPTHGNAWLEYVRGLQPYDILLLDPDIQQVSDAHRASPESEITLRRWDWDDARTEQNPEGIYAMLRDDPEGLARWQVDQYGALVNEYEQEAKRRGIPFPEREQLVVHLTNEPDTNILMPQINRNTVVACKLLRNIGLKPDALNLSTGHPAHLRDGAPDWSPLNEAIDAIMWCDGYAVCHEYFNDLGITDPSVYPWHIGRTSKWAPRGPKYKIGEFGLEMILNGRKDDHHGYLGIISNEQMVSATEWHLANLRDDVLADRFYMTDYIDRKWRTFDSTPIHAQLIEVGRRHPSKPFVPSKPIDIRLPSVNKPIPVSSLIVTVKDGANIRSGPSTAHAKISTALQWAELKVTGKNEAGDWYRVDANGQSGWIYGGIVKTGDLSGVVVVSAPEQPAQPSQPIAMGIIDPLTALAFLQVESGNQAFIGGLLTIRFEVHRFKANLGNDELFNRHFKFVPGNYAEQYWRLSPDAEWRNAHGTQSQRHTLLNFARSINDTAALRSTGMGMAQVMGENHARVGYPTPRSMFDAFSNPHYGVNAQLMAFVNYVLSDADLFTALRQRDWYTAVTKYNGEGQQHIYIPALENAIVTIKQNIGA